MSVAKIRAVVLPVLALMAVMGLAASAFAQGVPVQPGSAPPSGFRSATNCPCHGELVAQWRQSMHAQALTDPVFQAKVNEAQSQAGPEIATFCKRCHSPIGNILHDPDGATYPEAIEGVTCMFCHQVVGDSGAHGNTSQLLVTDLTRRAQIKNPQAPHRAAYSGFYTSSQFCGGCHSVINPVTGVRLDGTYQEWASSVYAKRGTQCQDCHMSAVPGVPGPGSGRAAPFGPVRNDLYGMTFVGGNVAQGPAAASTATLQSAATIDIDGPDVVAPGFRATVTVHVTNSGAGHDLPTGLTDERQMWLAVYAETPGQPAVLLGEQRFGTVLADAKGKHPAEIWNAASVYSDVRIPPKGSATSSYTFQMPPSAGTAYVVATLNYQSLPEALAVEAGVANPVTVMASTARPFYANESLARAAAASASQTQRTGAQGTGRASGGQASAAPPPTYGGTVWLFVLAAFLVLAVALVVRAIVVAPRRREPSAVEPAEEDSEVDGGSS